MSEELLVMSPKYYLSNSYACIKHVYHTKVLTTSLKVTRGQAMYLVIQLKSFIMVIPIRYQLFVQLLDFRCPMLTNLTIIVQLATIQACSLAV